MADTNFAMEGSSGGAGQIYAALVMARLAEEEKRGSSLQARGLAIVTTSGTLVTLIFAIAQFELGGRVLARFPSECRWLLAIAVVAFVGAAFGGLLANLPRVLVVPDLSDLAERIESRWGAPSITAAKTIAVARAQQLEKLEGANGKAARVVLAGLVAEVLAIALASAAVIATLFAG